MGLIQSVKGWTPKIDSGVFIAESAVVIGDVTLGPDVSIWYQTVLRGDVGGIRVGARTNIQDLTMIHCTGDGSETVIGEDVTVGHRAVLHGCTIEDETLIGMGAIVLDGAVVRRHVLVAAGAVVPPSATLESGFLYAGVPAKKIKPLTDARIAFFKESAAHYLSLKSCYGGEGRLTASKGIRPGRRRRLPRWRRS